MRLAHNKQLAIDTAPPRGTAVLSVCGTYRYRLARELGGVAGTCLWVMLNPSTATADADDPTIRRCVGFARDWGFARIEVVNLFALRSTDPAALRTHLAPIGPENDRHILDAARDATRVMCAWGAHGVLQSRGECVGRLLLEREIPMHALAVTKYGEPVHPLYQPKTARPVRWSPR